MNDEIKEILDRLEGRKNWYLHQQKNNGVFNDEDYMAYMLLDYITNLQHTEDLYNQLLKDYDELQQENNNLKTSLDESQEVVIELQQENERLKLDKDIKSASEIICENLHDVYKSRIEKAVEYIENTPLYETTYDYNMEEELEIQNVSDETASNKLLDILNGRSDE